MELEPYTFNPQAFFEDIPALILFWFAFCRPYLQRIKAELDSLKAEVHRIRVALAHVLRATPEPEKSDNGRDDTPTLGMKG